MSSNTNTDIWFAGAFAAFTVDLLIYPLDTLKTRIQSPNYKTLYKTTPKSKAATTTTTSPLPVPLKPSTLLPRLTRQFNPLLFRNLYQGLPPIILITLPSSGAFFTTYEALKTQLSSDTFAPPNSTLYLPRPAIHALSSAGAELVSCAILTPAEVVKQNAQVFQAPARARGRGRGGTSPTWEVVKQFQQQPRRLWRGYTALAARNLPFTALQFPVFEHLKAFFLARRKAKRARWRREGAPVRVDGIWERARITALSAALAGTGAAWVTTPIDVVKTRIMLGAGDEVGRTNQGSESHAASRNHSSGEPAAARGRQQPVLDIAKQILKTEGIRGLFRGALLRSLWTAFGSGLYLGCYEGVRHYLEERRRDQDAGGGRGGGDVLMEKERDWKGVRVGIGPSRSQGENVEKSAWQD